MVREQLREPLLCQPPCISSLIPVSGDARHAGLAGWEHGPAWGGPALGYCTCFVHLEFTVSFDAAVSYFVLLVSHFRDAAELVLLVFSERWSG